MLIVIVNGREEWLVEGAAIAIRWAIETDVGIVEWDGTVDLG